MPDDRLRNRIRDAIDEAFGERALDCWPDFEREADAVMGVLVDALRRAIVIPIEDHDVEAVERLLGDPYGDWLEVREVGMDPDDTRRLWFGGNNAYVAASPRGPREAKDSPGS